MWTVSTVFSSVSCRVDNESSVQHVHLGAAISNLWLRCKFLFSGTAAWILPVKIHWVNPTGDIGVSPLPYLFGELASSRRTV